MCRIRSCGLISMLGASHFRNGLLANDLLKEDGSDATAIVAANGGSDLIYVPDHSAETVRRIVSLLWTYDYVGRGVHRQEIWRSSGDVPAGGDRPGGCDLVASSSARGGLQSVLSEPGGFTDGGANRGYDLAGRPGDARWNRPREYLQQHGGDGPRFQTGVRRFDSAPVSNADIAPTLLKLMAIPAQPHGALNGRSIDEALTGGNGAGGGETTASAVTGGERRAHGFAIPGI